MRRNYSPAPRKRGAMPGGAKARKVYEQCHLAWRAGVLSDWYYGRRSPSDPTIVWEVNGREFLGSAFLDVSETVAELVSSKGIASISWGEEWIGYRSVVVTYANGKSVCERLAEDGQAVEIVAA